MNGLALCAGVGGIELGLKLAFGDAYRTICFVEREAYAATTLLGRMEDEALDRAPIWDDLTTFDGRPWRGGVDIVTAGFPCQPFSLAGKRQGTADDRWIWPDIFRIICEVGPHLVFLENVPGLFTCGLGHILGDLAAGGFDAEWGVFSAAEVGAPHLRERVFILAYPESDRGWLRSGGGIGSSGEAQADVINDGEKEFVADAECSKRGPDTQSGSDYGEGKDREGKASGGAGERRQDVADAVNDGSHKPEWNEAKSGSDGAVDRVSKRNGWWAVEPDVGRVAHGIPFRVDRLRALGNGVVPLVAAKAIRNLMKEIES